MQTTNQRNPEVIFDFAEIDAITPMRRLSPTWNGGWKDPPYLLPRLDYISTSKARSAFGHTGPFAWSNPKTGNSGVGAVSLVAEILKIAPNEAARRTMAFLCPGSLADQVSFLKYFTDLKDRRNV